MFVVDLHSELNSIKQQSAELSEAERLERQAVELRERAVAHGTFLAPSISGFY